MVSGGKGQLVRDMCLLNPYQGVQVAGSGLNERGVVENVTGQPLSIGISVEGAGDVCRLRNIHWNPYWNYGPGNGTAYDWMHANGIAFRFGRSDEQFSDGLFAFGYNVGVQFFNQTTGSFAGTTYGTFQGCSLDQCTTAIKCDAGNYQGINWIGGGIAAGDVSQASGKLNLRGVRFWSFQPQSISHTGGILTIDGCNFHDTMAVSSSGSAFSFNGNILENTSSRVTLSGAVKATVTANTLVGAAFSTIYSSSSTGTVVQANNN
jgi:hypothetical protein